MPGFVAHAGLADAVLPLDKIAEEIVRRVGSRARWPLAAREA
jgi:chemotaxis response regulator CheB